MGKETKESESSVNPCSVSPIARPLAPKKLHKKLMKLVKKATKEKIAKRGVREVVKAIKKGEKGIALLAADIFPVDVISHLPVLCEESGITYCYVNSRSELGEAGLSKRPTSIILIPKCPKEEEENYQECLSMTKSLF